MNKLTSKQLDMLKRLQLKISKSMGEWQEGEEGFCIEHRRAYIDNCPFAADKYSECDGEQLRIPKPIDWQNPERGLWGMIDSDEIKLEKFTSSMEDVHYFLAIGDRKVIIESNLFTALLKALCEQEGV